MLNRVSVNAILKSLFGLMAMAVVTLLVLNSWDSWTRLRDAAQMTNNADVAMHLFGALHNMRSDRSNTMRELGADKAGEPSDNLKRFRTGEMAGLQGALASLRLVEFPAGSTAVADFEKSISRLIEFQKQADAALRLQKGQRPAGLADEFAKNINVF